MSLPVVEVDVAGEAGDPVSLVAVGHGGGVEVRVRVCYLEEPGLRHCCRDCPAGEHTHTER